jgi:hypothetical protein
MLGAAAASRAVSTTRAAIAGDVVDRRSPPRNRCERVSHRHLQPAEPAREVFPEMHSQRAAVAREQHLEVAAGLCGLDESERVRLAGHGNVDTVVARDHEVHAGVRSALVRLTGRVQEPRAELEARRNAPSVADAVPHRLEHLVVRVAHLEIREQREVVTRVEPGEMRGEVALERPGAAQATLERGPVRLIREQIDAIRREDRCLDGQRAALFVLRRELARRDLARLDVRLVERIAC